MSTTGWYAFDLDGTLAEYHGWQGLDHIGAPVPAMVERVKALLAEGKDVRIFTARVYEGSGRDRMQADLARHYVELWCREHIGTTLVVTNVKDFSMVELYDDRCKQVQPNTGRLVEEMGPPCPFCGEEAIATAKQNDVVVGLVCFVCGKVLWQPASTAANAPA